jgi:hypothetical protein
LKLLAVFGEAPLEAPAAVSEFAVADQETIDSVNLFQTDGSAVRAIQHFDIGWRHENSWGLLTTSTPIFRPV